MSAPFKSRYPKKPYDVGNGTGLLQSCRVRDQPVYVRPELPGTIFLVHGVNDVGISYGEIEAGLCEGLNRRLQHADGAIRAAPFRGFTEADRGRLEEDPEAVFFRRQDACDSYSPVIPFYWGYREREGSTRDGRTLPHGQNTDRYGNRLDKDFSKEGGPFVNATSTLPDMWNKGSVNSSTSDWAIRDPLRPLLSAPGRLYMVLAAQRLAMLVAMIRDYHPDETVSLVAHSQGCMLSLLAQAFLGQRGQRPADTLVLTHPPYSLEDSLGLLVKAIANPDKVEAEDAAMRGRYDGLEGRQTLHARLQTLANLVELVATRRGAVPAFDTLKTRSSHVVGAKWEPTGDRDNRGKVYLYFCPEDLTVGLQNVKGIGWQGVPDFLRGGQAEAPSACEATAALNRRAWVAQVLRRPFAELTRWNRAGADGRCLGGFFQRVFTARKRPDPDTGQTVMVGQPQPHDFALRLRGEDESDHAAQMGWRHPVNQGARASLPLAEPQRLAVAPRPGATDEELARRRAGWVRINGEPLPEPVAPDMRAGALPADNPRMPAGDPAGSWEMVDGIDAAIAGSSRFGALPVWQLLDASSAAKAQTPPPGAALLDSPEPALHDGPVVLEQAHSHEALRDRINHGKRNTQCTPKVMAVYQCLSALRRPIGKLLVQRLETPDEARLRWQHEKSLRSCHGAIFGSRLNHRNVTAWDVAIGQGSAVSDPYFRAYLCAVADWRLIKPDSSRPARPGFLTWDKFIQKFQEYFSKEPEERKALIEGTSDYYSTGCLPGCIPVLPEGLPPAVVCETDSGRRINQAPTPAQGQACEATKSHWTLDDIDTVQPRRRGD